MWFGFLGHSDRIREAGEKARLLHGNWLTRALSGPPDRWPSIPLKRVSDGGYSGLMRTQEGRDWAELWWETALLRMDTDHSRRPR